MSLPRDFCFHVLVALVLILAFSTACRSDSSFEWPDAFTAASALGRGVNLGNALEAPNEGDWGVTLSEELFDAVVEAGFDSVRVPTKWSAHADNDPPYAIDETFFQRIDWVLDEALERRLVVVLNVHHYDELVADPAGHSDRFLAIWQQIAQRYADRPPTVYFELLNEPNSALDPATWNGLAAKTIDVVRETNPERTIVVGSAVWNRPELLPDLSLPEGDGHLVATFHYYDPFPFTHQGAEWVPGSDPWLGTTWDGTEEERALIEDAFDQVATWSAEHDRPVFLGEFGAYAKADLDSRARWTDAVARTAEEHGFSWAYWEFAAGFGIWDPDTGEWNDTLRNALLPR